MIRSLLPFRSYYCASHRLTERTSSRLLSYGRRSSGSNNDNDLRFRKRKFIQQRKERTGEVEEVEVLNHESSSAIATTDILKHNSLVIGRQLEMMNVFLGYEQANKYAIYRPPTSTADTAALNSPIGYIAEYQGDLGTLLQRQLFRTHRPFKATIMDQNGQVLLKLSRPFQFINSRLSVFDANDNLLGQVVQQWHPFKRQYNLFLNNINGTFNTTTTTSDDGGQELEQFGYISAPFLSWEFMAKDGNENVLSAISKQLTGLAREIFTDTSVYSLEMANDLSEAEKAVMLATAICIDFDYFSRHSGGGGGWWFIPMLIFWE